MRLPFHMLVIIHCIILVKDKTTRIARVVWRLSHQGCNMA